MKTVAFCRVSTSLQEYERLINELSSLAQKNGWAVEAIFAEKISGAKKNQERIELMKMVDYVKSHNINKVLVTELSRLGKIKQKVSGCFRTDSGANDFAKLHSIAETAMKNGNSKYNAILAVVQQ